MSITSSRSQPCLLLLQPIYDQKLKTQSIIHQNHPLVENGSNLQLQIISESADYPPSLIMSSSVLTLISASKTIFLSLLLLQQVVVHSLKVDNNGALVLPFVCFPRLSDPACTNHVRDARIPGDSAQPNLGSWNPFTCLAGQGQYVAQQCRAPCAAASQKLGNMLQPILNLAFLILR